MCSSVGEGLRGGVADNHLRLRLEQRATRRGQRERARNSRLEPWAPGVEGPAPKRAAWAPGMAGAPASRGPCSCWVLGRLGPGIWPSDDPGPCWPGILMGSRPDGTEVTDQERAVTVAISITGDGLLEPHTHTP